MLESKFALNNLNFKCYIQFFFVRARIGPKKWGGQFDPGKPRIGQHPGKGGVKITHLILALLFIKQRGSEKSGNWEGVERNICDIVTHQFRFLKNTVSID